MPSNQAHVSSSAESHVQYHNVSIYTFNVPRAHIFLTINIRHVVTKQLVPIELEGPVTAVEKFQCCVTRHNTCFKNSKVEKTGYFVEIN